MIIHQAHLPSVDHGQYRNYVRGFQELTGLPTRNSEEPFFCTEGFPCADFTLPAFTATTFSNIAVTENHDTSGGLPSNPTTCDLTVANSTVTLAAPSALSGEGTSFSVSAGPGAGAG